MLCQMVACSFNNVLFVVSFQHQPVRLVWWVFLLYNEILLVIWIITIIMTMNILCHMVACSFNNVLFVMSFQSRPVRLWSRQTQNWSSTTLGSRSSSPPAWPAFCSSLCLQSLHSSSKGQWSSTKTGCSLMVGCLPQIKQITWAVAFLDVKFFVPIMLHLTPPNWHRKVHIGMF